MIKAWQKRNIGAFFCENRDEARAKLLELVPISATIGISGSRTLDELEIIKNLESRGNRVYNQYKAGITRQENLELRRQGAGAEYYLASANAVSATGELVFFSAFGNRTAGVSGARHAIIVCGVNKLCDSLDKALARAREYATPLNCKRLDWNTPCFKDGVCRKDICLFNEYKRMCCQVLVIEAEAAPGRLEVVLVNEALGF